MKDSRLAPEMQQFFYREKALEDAQTLEGCNIVNESVIQLVGRRVDASGAGSNPAGQTDSKNLTQTMSDPLVQFVLANPELLKQIIATDQTLT